MTTHEREAVHQFRDFQSAQASPYLVRQELSDLVKAFHDRAILQDLTYFAFFCPLFTVLAPT